MNKSVRLAAVAIIAALLAGSASYAEEPASPQGQGGMQPAMQAEQDPQAIANRKAEEELELKNRKSEMLLRIKNKMDEMQKSQACIEAAATREALHSCRPSKGGGEGMPGGGMMKHEGMQGSPMNGSPSQ